MTCSECKGQALREKGDLKYTWYMKLKTVSAKGLIISRAIIDSTVTMLAMSWEFKEDLELALDSKYRPLG